MNNGLPTITAPARAKTIEEMASDRAVSDPLPGALADAFLEGDIHVGDVLVRKMVASDYVLFKFLDSPILRQFLELAKPQDKMEEIAYTDEEEWEMCWQFTHSPRENRDMIGDSLTRETTQIIIAAVMEQVKRNMVTAQRYVAEASEKGEITFFRETRTG
jgi:hypothetical protein